MMTLVERTIGAAVEVVADLCEGHAFVRADRSQLEQVFMNLVVNARDAMPDGGTLTLRTSSGVPDGQFRRPNVSIRPGAYVLLAVRDTGCGIPSHVQERVFEPFFTTKEPNEGTGLGLSIVQGIVRQAGGCVELESAPGEGTEVRVYVPEASVTADDTGHVAGECDGGGNETILLVEDDDAVRLFEKKVLESLGYSLLEAGSAQAALELAADLDRPIDLVLVDMLMPRMNGDELVQRLREIRNGFKVLYVSGFGGAPVMAASGVAPAPLLQKPYSPQKLARKVRKALDAD
jgi:CheY-like chemotaxis protein